jgi:hypothetical protein
MGSETGKKFRSYWDTEVLGANAAPEKRARFVDEQRPSGGLGLALPAEVMLIPHYIAELAQTELGHEVLKTAGAAAGTAVAKFLWKKLRAFFSPSSGAIRPQPASVVIIVNRTEIIFDPQHMEDTPPASLIDAIREVDGVTDESSPE